jgi:pimeloyl-ACP methyl ester carboxylesterase
LNAHPVTFQDAQNNHTVSLDGDELVSWLFSAMYVTELIPRLPEAIMQIRNGNYDLISQYFGKLLDRGISDGMYYSVECGEDMAFTTKQDLMQAANVLRPEIRPGILAGLQDDFAICQAWGQKPVPASQKQPVTSSLPTLILSGEYDPITPSSNAELAMQTLSRSFLFVFPATGHGVFSTNNCPDSIMSAFMQNPSVKPDASCIAAMTEPAFQ